MIGALRVRVHTAGIHQNSNTYASNTSLSSTATEDLQKAVIPVLKPRSSRGILKIRDITVSLYPVNLMTTKTNHGSGR